MAVGAIIQDGKVLETASQSSVQKAATSGNGMDKDAFLQLLVAQMKYQDPLQPTSNTEYISQYATFSQVEQMQNMSATMELSRASSMVGQLVEVQSTDSNGDTKSLQGKVDYVSYENNKAYVSIDGVLYSADDVVAVVDQEYQSAFDLAISFATALNKLPSIENLTVEDKGAVKALQDGFNNMTSYQQSFISEDYIEALQLYVERMAALTEAAEEVENEGAAEKVEDEKEAGSVEEVTQTGDIAQEDTTGEDTAQESAVDENLAEEADV